MRLLACLFLLAACACPAPATGGSFVRADDERCYREDTARLPVGGVDDKAWRGAVRFPLDALPEGTGVTSARLELYFDGACVAPRRKVGPCAKAEYTVDAHAIRSPGWTKEREVDFDPVATGSTTVSTAVVHWSSWDLTGLVSDWASGVAPDRGVLLKLAEEEEHLGASGPNFPSASFATAALRPRLVVSYVVTTSGLSP